MTSGLHLHAIGRLDLKVHELRLLGHPVSQVVLILSRDSRNTRIFKAQQLG